MSDVLAIVAALVVGFVLGVYVESNHIRGMIRDAKRGGGVQ